MLGEMDFLHYLCIVWGMGRASLPVEAGDILSSHNNAAL